MRREGSLGGLLLGTLSLFIIFGVIIAPLAAIWNPSGVNEALKTPAILLAALLLIGAFIYYFKKEVP